MEISTQQDSIVAPIPKWLQIRFGQLWDTFGHATFSLGDATKALDESKEVVTVILSRLRKSGWTEVSFDEKDFRRRKYSLKNPAEFFRNIKGVRKEENA